MMKEDMVPNEFDGFSPCRVALWVSEGGAEGCFVMLRKG